MKQKIIMMLIVALTYPEIIRTIDECVDLQTRHCEDLICESDLTYQNVIRQTGDAVKYCFARKMEEL